MLLSKFLQQNTNVGVESSLLQDAAHSSVAAQKMQVKSPLQAMNILYTLNLLMLVQLDDNACRYSIVADSTIKTCLNTSPNHAALLTLRWFITDKCQQQERL